RLRAAILFEVDDVQVIYIELKKRGVVFLSEPYKIYTGLAVEFEDPFGNRLGITDYSQQASSSATSPTATGPTSPTATGPTSPTATGPTGPTSPRLTARVNPTIYAPPPHSTRDAQHRTVYSRVDPC